MHWSRRLYNVNVMQMIDFADLSSHFIFSLSVSVCLFHNSEDVCFLNAYNDHFVIEQS